jgi:hypothetical protein
MPRIETTLQIRRSTILDESSGFVPPDLPVATIPIAGYSPSCESVGSFFDPTTGAPTGTPYGSRIWIDDDRPHAGVSRLEFVLDPGLLRHVNFLALLRLIDEMQPVEYRLIAPGGRSVLAVGGLEQVVGAVSSQVSALISVFEATEALATAQAGLAAPTGTDASQLRAVAEVFEKVLAAAKAQYGNQRCWGFTNATATDGLLRLTLVHQADNGRPALRAPPLSVSLAATSGALRQRGVDATPQGVAKLFCTLVNAHAVGTEERMNGTTWLTGGLSYVEFEHWVALGNPPVLVGAHQYQSPVRWCEPGNGPGLAVRLSAADVLADLQS